MVKIVIASLCLLLVSCYRVKNNTTEYLRISSYGYGDTISVQGPSRESFFVGHSLGLTYIISINNHNVYFETGCCELTCLCVYSYDEDQIAILSCEQSYDITELIRSYEQESQSIYSGDEVDFNQLYGQYIEHRRQLDQPQDDQRIPMSLSHL